MRGAGMRRVQQILSSSALLQLEVLMRKQAKRWVFVVFLVVALLVGLTVYALMPSGDYLCCMPEVFFMPDN